MPHARTTTLFAALCVLGTAIPLVPFVLWLIDHGVEPRRFAEEMFENRISSFFALDVLLSAVTILVACALNPDRLTRNQRVGIAAGCCLIGVSLGLPLYFWLRERNALTRSR
jgi:hypothetical protein